jgi:hypothetical protein
VVHSHAEKVNLLRGIAADMTLEASCRIIVDVWEARFRAFNTFCRTPARYGGFDFCFQCHMTSEEVVKDTVWYRAARAEPKKHLPRFYDWLATPRLRGAIERMTPDKKLIFERRGAAFLEAAEASHLKWNAQTWLRPRFLLGVLCLEERREMFATELLQLLGHGARLDAALGGRARESPRDDVDAELLRRLRESHTNGSLAKVSHAAACARTLMLTSLTHLCAMMMVCAAGDLGVGARFGGRDRRAARARN